MENQQLAQVDELRRRLDATYAEASEALKESQGDMLGALAALETKQRDSSELCDLFERVVDIAKEIKGLRLRWGKRVLREVPLKDCLVYGLLAAGLVGVLAELSLEAIKKED
jgi:hypothetical protein